MTDTWISLGLYVFGVIGGFIGGWLRGYTVAEKDYSQRIRDLIKHHNQANTARIIQVHTLREQIAKFHMNRDERGRFLPKNKI